MAVDVTLAIAMAAAAAHVDDSAVVVKQRAAGEPDGHGPRRRETLKPCS